MTDGPFGPCPFDPRGAWTAPRGRLDTERGTDKGGQGMRVSWWKPAAALLTAMGLAGATLPLYAAQTARPQAPAMRSNVVVDPRVLGVAHGPVAVIVQKLDPADRGPEARIRDLGGTVTRD